MPCLRSVAPVLVLLLAALAAVLAATACAENRGDQDTARFEISRDVGLFSPVRTPAGGGPPAPQYAAEATVPEPPPPTRGTDADVNIRVNQDNPGDSRQSEVSIAINPTDPLNLVATGIGLPSGAPNLLNRFYASFDGGQTWVDGDIVEPAHDQQFDPTIAFCGDGSAYLESTSANTGWGAGSAIFVYKSTDGGLTWPTKSTMFSSSDFPFPDKPWITCDTTGSAFDGRIYIGWLKVLSSLNPTARSITLNYSADGGSTWSSDVAVSDANALQNSSQVVVGPGGEVYVAWVQAPNRFVPEFGVNLFDRSTDGGVTFGTDIEIYPYDASNVIEAEGNPVLAVDQTAGPHGGNLYFASSDMVFGDRDILFSRSTDGGTTWSPPIRINDDPSGNGAVQFHPAMVVDPDGRVIVTFNDNRHDNPLRLYKRWGVISRDGGVTFDTNFVISDVAHDASVGWTGDYDAMTASADTIHPLWADTRAGITDDCDVYTDRYPNIFHYDEVDGVQWLSATEMDFETQDGRFGQDLDYDIVDGLLSELHADSGFDRSTCSAAVWSAPPFVDGRVPPATDGRYYLVRVNGPDGVGTHGDGRPRARTNARDPLDETLPVCP